MSKQEDFRRPEKPLEKTPEIDNEARISKKAEMKKKFNRIQKWITLWDIQLSSLTFLLLLIFFIDTIISVISSTQTACDVMCVQYVQKQPPEVFFKKGVL